MLYFPLADIAHRHFPTTAGAAKESVIHTFITGGLPKTSSKDEHRDFRKSNQTFF